MKKFINIILLFISLFLFADCNAQFQQVWVQRYSSTGSNTDEAKSIVVDTGGNVYVTGFAFGSNSNNDYATIKYNSGGVQQWIAFYNGPINGSDAAVAIAVDRSGNIYVTGNSGGPSFQTDFATIKYNSSGTQQWVTRYERPGDNAVNALTIDDSANVYITGHSTGSSSNDDYTTIKYNSSGLQQWVQIYNGPGNGIDGARSIAVDTSGNVYVTGFSTGSGTGRDYCTIKYNAAGVQQWVSRYNGPQSAGDEAYSLALDVSGNVYVTGSSYGGNSDLDCVTIKYNSSGVQQWVQTYNGPGNSIDVGNCVAVDFNGNVIVGCSSYGVSSRSDYCVIKYNPNGVQQWVSRYDGPPGNGNDFISAIALDTVNNIYVTGFSEPVYSGIFDYATVKYNSSGVQQWVLRYNGPANLDDEAYGIALDKNGNVFVTGRSEGSVNDYDYATIKYSLAVGIQHTSNEILENFALDQNYPNPFNPSTKIKFAVPKSAYAKLAIYDILGREISTLVNEQLKPGTYEVDWNASNFPSGVYFFKLNINSFIETKKMILIK
jgi:uncharacterized delta-60 repeat protein